MEDICIICGTEDVSDLGTQVCYKCFKSIDGVKGADDEKNNYIFNKETSRIEKIRTL